MNRMITTVTLFALTATQALAAICPDGTFFCGPTGTPGPIGTPAPGPIAGAGLGYLLLAGGYYAVRHWRKRS